MSECTVSRNGGWGVSAYSWAGDVGRAVEVRSSVVQSNAAGISFGDSIRATLVGNVVSDNTGAGVQFNLTGGRLGIDGVTGNVIRRNEVGVRFTGGGPSPLAISGNDIYQNTSFELRNETGIALIAPDCFWGEPTTTEWTAGQVNLSRIYDLQDNPSSGQVLIQSIRGTPALQPPRFTLQPQSVNALPGDTVTLSAVASGSEPITYQWYHDGTIVPQATTTDLTLASLDASKAGAYFAVAANAARAGHKRRGARDAPRAA